MHTGSSHNITHITNAIRGFLVKIKYLIFHSPKGFSGFNYNTEWGTFARLIEAQFTIKNINEVMSYECPLL